jgi:hypothetical protein
MIDLNHVRLFGRGDACLSLYLLTIQVRFPIMLLFVKVFNINRFALEEPYTR